MKLSGHILLDQWQRVAWQFKHPAGCSTMIKLGGFKGTRLRKLGKYLSLRKPWTNKSLRAVLERNIALGFPLRISRFSQTAFDEPSTTDWVQRASVRDRLADFLVFARKWSGVLLVREINFFLRVGHRIRWWRATQCFRREGQGRKFQLAINLTDKTKTQVYKIFIANSSHAKIIEEGGKLRKNKWSTILKPTTFHSHVHIKLLPSPRLSIRLCVGFVKLIKKKNVG